MHSSEFGDTIKRCVNSHRLHVTMYYVVIVQICQTSYHLMYLQHDIKRRSLSTEGTHQLHTVDIGIHREVFRQISIFEVRANETGSGGWAQIKTDAIERCDVGMIQPAPNPCLP